MVTAALLPFYIRYFGILRNHVFQFLVFFNLKNQEKKTRKKKQENENRFKMLGWTTLCTAQRCGGRLRCVSGPGGVLKPEWCCRLGAFFGQTNFLVFFDFLFFFVHKKKQENWGRGIQPAQLYE